MFKTSRTRPSHSDEQSLQSAEESETESMDWEEVRSDVGESAEPAASDEGRTAPTSDRPRLRSKLATPQQAQALEKHIAQAKSYLGEKSPAQRLGEQRYLHPDGSKLIVSRGIRFKGDIKTQYGLVVEGQVDATAEGQSLQIGGPGVFTGDARVDTAEVAGRFDGELVARKQLIVRATGKVSGQISYGELLIEQGGQVSGHVQVLTAENTDDSETQGTGNAIQLPTESADQSGHPEVEVEASQSSDPELPVPDGAETGENDSGDRVDHSAD